MNTKQRSSMGGESKKPYDECPNRTIQVVTPQRVCLTLRSMTASTEKNCIHQENLDWGKFEFPSCLKRKTDFRNFKNLKNCIIIYISFQNLNQTNYLVKLSFFRTIPLRMIKQISSRLQAKSMKKMKLYVKGDKGDFMYIIFDGKIEVLGLKNVLLGPKTLIGRSALVYDYFINNTIQAVTVIHLLILNRIYQITILIIIILLNQNFGQKNNYGIRRLEQMAYYQEKWLEIIDNDFEQEKKIQKLIYFLILNFQSLLNLFFQISKNNRQILNYILL
ncbi:unnamed protein product [Paramecium sonneborni]|uniref:Cyclic nucleotide-binding domain-containing protein n=1 Tax=Paramecium sonneborni TaxID=65129 RepID=A0A8S1RR91_9CILI|nr:unnamed protein product [Paramecium sonneborni]